MGEEVRGWMNNLTGRVSGVALLVACSALLFWLLDSRRSVSANNDSFLQILAAEGIREGKGYGFSVGEQFISIGERAPQTRWPPGLTLIAAGLEICRIRPVEWLSAAMPWIGVMSLLLLAYHLMRELGLRLLEATILAMAVTGTGAFLDWHGEVGTEPAFFALLLCTMLVVGCGRQKPTLWAIPFVWAFTLIRSAGIYLVAGIALLYGAERRRPLWAVVLRVGGAFAVLGAPLLAFHVYYGLSRAHMENPHAGVAEQLLGQIALLHEVIVPHTTFMKGHRDIAGILGSGVLLVVSVCGWRAFRLFETWFNLITISAVMGISYLLLLTASATAVGYDWAGVYRVSAVSLMLIAIAFWAGVVMCARSPVIQRILLAAAMAVAAGKFGFAFFRHPNPAFQANYTDTVASFQVYAEGVDSGPVALCAADSFERNVSYALMYAVKHGEVLPRPLLWMAFGEGSGSGACHTIERSTGEWVKRELPCDASEGESCAGKEDHRRSGDRKF